MFFKKKDKISDQYLSKLKEYLLGKQKDFKSDFADKLLVLHDISLKMQAINTVIGKDVHTCSCCVSNIADNLKTKDNCDISYTYHTIKHNDLYFYENFFLIKSSKYTDKIFYKNISIFNLNPKQITISSSELKNRKLIIITDYADILKLFFTNK